jgi:hypothetical protein
MQLTVRNVSRSKIAIGGVVGTLAVGERETYSLSNAEMDAIRSRLIELQNDRLIEWSVASDASSVTPQVFVYDPSAASPDGVFIFASWASLMGAVAPLAAASTPFKIIFKNEFNHPIPAGNYDFGGNCVWEGNRNSLVLTGSEIRGVCQMDRIQVHGGAGELRVTVPNLVLNACSFGLDGETLRVETNTAIWAHDSYFYGQLAPTITDPDGEGVTLHCFGQTLVENDATAVPGLTCIIYSPYVFFGSVQDGSMGFSINGTTGRKLVSFGALNLPTAQGNYFLRPNGGELIADTTGASWYVTTADTFIVRINIAHQTAGTGSNYTVDILINGTPLGAGLNGSTAVNNFVSESAAIQVPLVDGDRVQVRITVPSGWTLSPRGIYVDLYGI